MPTRTTNRLRFHLERLILRGAHYRLLVIAALIGLVSVGAGVLVRALGSGFDSTGEAVWWAFLRMTDPGYLGDDAGLALRTVSTVVTILGYVLFLGALIAILTQWLNQTIRDLESGRTPIALNDHILILGWSNRTSTIVRELVLSEGRVKRFLRRHGARSLNIAILAEELDAGLVQELRDRLGPLWSERQVTLRSGTPLRIEHLRRVDFLNAGAILVPAAEFDAGDAMSADARTIKTLLSITSHPAQRSRELPLVIAEVFDARKIPIARRAYGGSIEILASDAIVSRLIAQNVRHRGLSQVYGELLTQGRGNELYIRELPSLVGRRLQDLHACFPDAVVLGAVRRDEAGYRPVLNPPGGFVLEEDDRLVLLARSYRDTMPVPDARPTPTPRATLPAPERATPSAKRVLILGWNHKAPALFREFDGYRTEHFELDVLSIVPTVERERILDRHGFRPDRVGVRQLDGDRTDATTVERLTPAAYDNIVLLANDRLDSGEEADARTILAYLILREVLPANGGPNIIVELMDPENAPLFRRKPGEVLISPLILSHMLAQVALRRELRSVFEELFGPGGAEISFRAAARYGATGEVRFRDLQRAVALRGEIALGVRPGGAADDAGRTLLNPARDHRWMMGPADEIVVLTTCT